MAMLPYPSPLRYPGGKNKIVGYVKALFEQNGLLDGDFAEPYAGGASVALSLLVGEYAGRIFLNDLDPAVHAFWSALLHQTDKLSHLIRQARTDMAEWQRQRVILTDPDVSVLERGFAAFYLNRTNRSGIIGAGVIGGQQQDGKWKIDARFNRRDLVRRISRIARYRGRIHLSNLDALDFIRQIVPTLDPRSLTYFDPPYYAKGEGLYAHAYAPDDHWAVAQAIGDMPGRWLLSYDNTPEIQQLYQQHEGITYDLSYSAQQARQGQEALFFSAGLRRPEGSSPAKTTAAGTSRLQTNFL